MNADFIMSWSRKSKDKLNNTYEFSQIYIDTKKIEVLGTDIKAFLNSDDFKINKDNDPRIFANTIKLSNEKSTFDKSIFTICEQKENEKCTPWTLQASKMTHEKKNKTIYYNNAVIKIYDFPIFYLPYLSHPDPTVSRRSGFLPPSFSDSKNLGASLSVPYFSIASLYAKTGNSFISISMISLKTFVIKFSTSALTSFSSTKLISKSI